MNESLLIEGMTEDGRRFRPSDWAERLATLAAVFSADRRLRYSPLLRPVDVNGVKGIAVALSLQREAPGVWRQVMEFARANRLRVKGLVPCDGEPAPLAIAC